MGVSKNNYCIRFYIVLIFELCENIIYFENKITLIPYRVDSFVDT